jgi:hypothetical protein
VQELAEKLCEGKRSSNMAKLLRQHLRAVGLERATGAFRLNEQRIRIRVHDLRGSFVTISLLNGKTEALDC